MAFPLGKAARQEKNMRCFFLFAVLKAMSDSDVVPSTVLRRRATVERWKSKNREKYLDQKRRLATRPEYKAHRREMYREKVDELTRLGLLPRKRGRPTMYVGPEALEMKRQRAREAAARYRARQLFSQRIKKDESNNSTTSESSD
jgi:hypothetical protein